MKFRTIEYNVPIIGRCTAIVMGMQRLIDSTRARYGAGWAALVALLVLPVALLVVGIGFLVGGVLHRYNMWVLRRRMRKVKK